MTYTLKCVILLFRAYMLIYISFYEVIANCVRNVIEI